MSTLQEWLDSLGLGKYAEAFRRHEVELSDLNELGEADLREVGLPLGPRRRVLKAIRQQANETPPTAQPNDSTQAERRQLTVMFVDIVGSTPLSEKLDPEDLINLIQTFKAVTSIAVKRFGGYIANYLGDGVLVYFGYPRAHEDDAERAVHAALEVISGLKAARTTEPLRVRIGIATGLVVVGTVHGHTDAERNVVLGETPNLAARLQSLAQPDTVLVAPATRDLCGEVFEFRDLGPHTLKGFTASIRPSQVTGVRSFERKFLATRATETSLLVGRDAEALKLQEAWKRAQRGAGGVVYVSGDAGIGKSRLIETLNDPAAADKHIRLSFQCSAYHESSALYPVQRQLERAAGIQAQDTPDKRLEKLRTVFDDPQPVQIALAANLLSIDTPDAALLAGISPQERLNQTLALLRGQLFAQARKKPVLVLFEDAHWIDPTSKSLLDSLLEDIRNLPILVVVTGRPGFVSNWEDHPQVTWIKLGTLGQDAIARIIARVAGGKSVPDEIRDQIAAKTDGIPLYVEEVTKGLLATGQLRDAGNSFTLRGSLPDLSVPSTLQDLLMARLDRLGRAKDVAQTGAVFGRQFTLSQLAEVTSLDRKRLLSALEMLMSSGIIRGGSDAGGQVFTFQHALIRDTAYESLLRRERQVLHNRAAEALLKVSPQLADTEPEVIAYHYAMASRADEAVRLWHLAGRNAIERSANREALVHLSRALDLVTPMPDSDSKARREIELQVLRGSALRSTQGIAATETGAAYSRVRELCAQIGDNTHLFPVLNGLYSFHLVRAEYTLARSVAAEMIELSTETGEIEPRMVGHRALGAVLLHLGDPSGARDNLHKALGLYDPSVHARLAYVYGTDHGAITSSFLGMAYCLSGHLDRAVEVQQEALTAARNMNHAYSVAQILTYLCLTHLLRRDVPAVLETAEQLESLSRKHSFAFMVLTAALWKGWGNAWLDPTPEKTDALRKATLAWANSGAGNYKPFFLTLIAELELRAGRHDECRAALIEAREAGSESQELWALAETHRIEGLLAEAMGQPCRPIFEKAIRIGQRQQASLFVLRAGVALCRHLHDAGQPETDFLEPLLKEINGGTDTPDVLAARQLIESFA